jgi:ribose/xylose/arabinose/galactoside ABC-type transport system permease subunit
MAENVDRPKSRRFTAKDAAKLLLRHENAILVVILIALTVVMSAVSQGKTASRDNIMNILLQSSMRGVSAIGQAFVILTSGIDLSVGGIGLMSSFLGAILMTEGSQATGMAHSQYTIAGQPIPIALAVLFMLLVGIGWGLANGSAVSRIGVPPLIVTLAMWQITMGVGYRLANGATVTNLAEGYAFFGHTEVAGVPLPVVYFLVVAVIGYFVLNHTTFGKSVYAVGGNRVSAWLSGINIKDVVLSVYAISGFLAGLAGVIMTSRAMSASMKSLSGLELDSIGAVAVGGISLAGGRGSLIGVVVGTIIIGVINNAMSVLGVSSGMMFITKGLVIFAAVAIDCLRRREAWIKQ